MRHSSTGAVGTKGNDTLGGCDIYDQLYGGSGGNLLVTIKGNDTFNSREVVQLQMSLKRSDLLARATYLGITKVASKSIATYQDATRFCGHLYTDAGHSAVTNEYFWEMTA